MRLGARPPRGGSTRGDMVAQGGEGGGCTVAMEAVAARSGCGCGRGSGGCGSGGCDLGSGSGVKRRVLVGGVDCAQRPERLVEQRMEEAVGWLALGLYDRQCQHAVVKRITRPPPRRRHGNMRPAAAARGGVAATGMGGAAAVLALLLAVALVAELAGLAVASRSQDRYWDHETEMPISSFSFLAYRRMSGTDGPGMALGNMAWSTSGKGGESGSAWVFTMPSNESVTLMPDHASTWKRRLEWTISTHTEDAFEGHDLVGSKFYIKMALHFPFVWHSVLRAGARVPASVAGQEPDGDEARWVRGYLVGLVEDMVVNIAASEGTAFCSDTVRHRSGLCNNKKHPGWGVTNASLRRLDGGQDPAYADGVSAPSGGNRPSAREVSNAMCAERNGSADGNRFRHTELLTFFGQLLDHDVGHTPTGNSKSNLLFKEDLDIPINKDDYLFFKVRSSGTELPMTRSVYTRQLTASAVRTQPNRLTSYIDGSVLYGSDGYRWHCLREKRSGRLRLMGKDKLLPKNRVADLGLTVENSPTSGPEFFVSGDPRANENVMLLALHHVFAREHNRLADKIARVRPEWDDTAIFESARSLVAAKLQQITYNEWLPCLLGSTQLPPYRGYKADVDATLSAFFTTAAFRLGHTLVNKEITRLGPGNQPLDGGPVSLRKGLFNPAFFEETGTDPFIRGSANTLASELDLAVVDGLRNFLFNDIPGEGGFDLVALNLQRARDHAIPDYNAARAAYGLSRKTSWHSVTDDRDVARRMADLYGSRPDDVDAFIGMLAEDPRPGSPVGELLGTALSTEFARLRDGDRFFYKNVRWPKALRSAMSSEIAAIEGDRITMRGLLLANTDIDTKDLPSGNSFCPSELRR